MVGLAIALWQLWEHWHVDQGMLDFYAAPGRFTTVGGDDFSSGAIGEVVEVVQGLLVYDLAAQPFYGVELTPIQAAAIHERDRARLLDITRAIDTRPLNEHRPRSPIRPSVQTDVGVLPGLLRGGIPRQPSQRQPIRIQPPSHAAQSWESPANILTAP